MPESVTSKVLSYESSDETVFKVEEGLITPLSVGEANLIIRTRDGSNVKKIIPVSVYEFPVLIESIEITNIVDGQRKMLIDETFEPELKILPLDANQLKLEYKSSDENIFTVNPESGLVTGKGEGTATLTITSVSNPEVFATCTFIVSEFPTAVEEIQLNPTTKSLMIGESFTLAATVLPIDAANKELIFSSSDESILTVNHKGLVTSLKSGTATITVSATDHSGVTATCEVTVLNMYYMGDWSVTASSYFPDNHPSLGNTSYGKGVKSILDPEDDVYSFWTNGWTTGGIGVNALPYWLVVDMKEVKDFNEILLHRKKDTSSASWNSAADTRYVELSYSNNVVDVSNPKDNEFTPIGDIDFGTAKYGQAGYEIEKSISFNKVSARYLRIKITQSNRAQNANIAFIKVMTK